MTDFDDLDDLLGPLRSPATTAELAAENDVVDLMAAAHHSSKENTMFTSRRARVATLIAAGIIGFGGVAAAGPKVFDYQELDEGPAVEVDEQDPVDKEIEEDLEGEKVEEKVADEVEQEQDAGEKVEDDVEGEKDDVVEVKIVEEAKVVQESSDVEPVDDPDFDESLCVDGNHGKTVSAVARGLGLGEDGTIHPDDYPTVTEAAHSSCGKTETTGVEADDDTDDDTDDETDVEEVQKDEDDDDADEIDEIDDHEDDDDEKADSEASQKQTGRPDKPGKSEHSNSRGKSDK